MIFLGSRNKLFIILIILLLFAGCSKDKGEKAEITKKDIAPKSLQSINKSILDILDDLGKIERIHLNMDIGSEESDMDNIEEDVINKSNSPKDEDNDNGNDNEDEEKDQKDESGQNNSKDQSQDKAVEQKFDKQEIFDQTWKEIDKKIEKIHSDWNTYEVEGLKKGASNERGIQFESSLNKMTKAIGNRRTIDIYDYGSQSLQNLKPYYDLYTDEIRGDIVELEYLVYQYYINAITGNKETALRIINNNTELVNRIKLKLKDDEKKVSDIEKIAIAINNLSRSLAEESKPLFIIKKDTLIQELKSLGQ